jgi:hypothetical protein
VGEPSGATPSPLRPIADKSGFIGDLSAKTFVAVGDSAPPRPTAWLPTERVARAWQAVVTEAPFPTPASP